ncbi:MULTISPECIES: GntR family transcriptional regulator [Chromohalobacter]|uniref:GntR family transcriptional regulator n=1 Tax=Chromohalobacter sarecensis TaxID=245294 RepID=A0ABV9D1Y8_9GAMM|nr:MULTISPECIES: GntR family transcriptional regulator [Chromohalobacter]MCK0714506.1 GntR family transcriptional regulator [Chromohalobacter sarecensis]MCK0746607.1 GntR family transcriptional regulator [Chromohalobacter nigrandesensis]
MNQRLSSLHKSHSRRPRLADHVYAKLKKMIFDFELIPGDHFSEADVVERFEASRTPVREALQRLQREGYVEVRFRSGWQVRPFDFEVFEQLYDVRMVLECSAIERLCAMKRQPTVIEELSEFWRIPVEKRSHDIRLSDDDQYFHTSLVAAAGNAEMASIHRDVSERIHIIRRLDFTQASRIEATFDEHAEIIHAIRKQHGEYAQQLMRTHIAASRDEVRKITLHMLHEARKRHEAHEDEELVKANNRGR